MIAGNALTRQGTMTEGRSRTLRAVLRNAVTWGAAWAAAGGAIVAALTLFSPDPAVESLIERVGLSILAGIGWGIRFGIAGAVIGTVFAGVIRLGYRGRRLADINPARFALLGAVVGGVGVPLFLQTMNVLSGDGPIAWGLVTDDAVWASVFGAAAAAGSIMLARRADTLAGGHHADQLEQASSVSSNPQPDVREAAPATPGNPAMGKGLARDHLHSGASRS
jgi:MFS family permease